MKRALFFSAENRIIRESHEADWIAFLLLEHEEYVWYNTKKRLIKCEMEVIKAYKDFL